MVWVKKYLKRCSMSSNKDITSIIADGLDSFVYSTTNKVVWSNPIEYDCYVWLAEAYPEIMAEFHAVRDITE